MSGNRVYGDAPIPAAVFPADGGFPASLKTIVVKNDVERKSNFANLRHTPGPWKFTKKITTFTVNGEGGTIAGSVGYMYDAESRSNAEANARLIAAAPDLLEAVQTVLECMERGLPVSAELLNGLVLSRLRAAETKATGSAA